MTLRERIEDNIAIWLLGTLLTGFLAGIGAYKSVLEISSQKMISATEYDQLKAAAKKPPSAAGGPRWQPYDSKSPFPIDVVRHRGGRGAEVLSGLRLCAGNSKARLGWVNDKKETKTCKVSSGSGKVDG